MHQAYSTSRDNLNLTSNNIKRFDLHHAGAFHLQSFNDCESVASGSITSKQRIDMMFEETRSVISDFQPPRRYYERRKVKSIAEGSNQYDIWNYNTKQRAKNDIQMKIEKMFSEVSSSEQETEPSPVTANQFAVRHIGSVPVASKITSLDGIQEPLTELYFEYRPDNFNRNLKDKIEVTVNGLQIEYNVSKEQKGSLKIHPFSSIAVWASVKFVYRKQSDNEPIEYAFLPLVANLEKLNSASLYRKLPKDESRYYQIRRYMDNSPLFVVVVRENDSPIKQFVCHCFVCESATNAIVLSATLYKVLLYKLGRNRILKLRNQRKKLRYANGISRLSSIGETIIENLESEKLENSDNCNEEGDNIDNDSISNNLDDDKNNDNDINNDIQNLRNINNDIKDLRDINNNISNASADNNNNININMLKYADKKTNSEEEDTSDQSSNSSPTHNPSLPRPPKRPPRKAKISPPYDHSKQLGIITQSTPDVDVDVNEIQVVSVDYIPGLNQRRPSNNLHRTESQTGVLRRSNSNTNVAPETGDILTKIAIPRSRSFLNADRLSTRYKRQSSVRQRQVPATHENQFENSPLGFMEMLNELQMQEGLNTLDEVLDAIINVDGMSFNDLKPIYKEFLLKLAMVLTKDELFIHSKMIMKKQKKKKVTRYKLKKIISTKRRLKNILQKPKIKIKSFNEKSRKVSKLGEKRTNNADTTSTDSFLINQQPKNVPIANKPNNVNQKRYKKKNSTSEDSDYPNPVLRWKKSFNKGGKDSSEDRLRASSSGYFTFSECSYDTESCACATVDRCYCSMGRKGQSKPTFKTKHKFNKTNELPYSSCTFDTDNCYVTSKCYCSKKRAEKKISLVEQLKQKGFAISESSSSRGNSPLTFQQNCYKNGRHSMSSKNGTKLSKSLKYMQNDSYQNKFPKRMDVYDNFPTTVVREDSSTLSSSTSSTSKNTLKPSCSSDNFAVDYSMFNRSASDFRRSREFYQPIQRTVYAEIHRSATNSSKFAPAYPKNLRVPHKKGKTKNNISKSTINPVFENYAIANHCSCNCMIGNSAMLENQSSRSIRSRNSSYFRRTNIEDTLGYLP